MRYTVRMSGLIRIVQSLPLMIALGVIAVIVYFVVSYTRSPLRAKEVLIKTFLVLTSILSIVFGLITAYAAFEGHVGAAEMFGAFLGVSLIALLITLICRHNFRKHHPGYQAKRQYAHTRSHTETSIRNLIEMLKKAGIGKQGFTLRELLLVAAIAVVLVVAIVPIVNIVGPQFANEQACAENRAIAARCLNVYYKAYRTIDEAHAQEAIEIAGGDDACPAGGKLVVTVDEETGIPTVTCTVHSGKTFVSTAE